MNTLQRQYQGFLQTHFLWKNSSLIELEQIEFQQKNSNSIQLKNDHNLRLGKLVERFVSEELRQDKTIKIIAENIQIQDNKTTIGELDCLLLQNNKPIHLEIIYKFYLYDASVSNMEIQRWIGPNRRDSFIQKLTKLKEKQLPLLYHEKTKSYLDALHISSEDITQKTYFKAQLFVPLADIKKPFSIINNNCIEGFYLYPKELLQFFECKFYIPSKHNWLVKPYAQINWLNFNDFTAKINLFLSEKNNPLCWMKKPNGELIKFFVVYW